jgi:hypothetical protein
VHTKPEKFAQKTTIPTHSRRERERERERERMDGRLNVVATTLGDVQIS